MLFGKGNEEIVKEDQESGKEMNLIKLGLTVAGGVAATVAGVYVGKKLYQTYCNPLLNEEVDCNNLPEEPLESEGTNDNNYNEVEEGTDDMITEANIINFSEIEEEVNTKENNQETKLSVRHELKDIFGPIEVGMNVYSTDNDHKLLILSADKAFQKLTILKRSGYLNEIEKEYIGHIKEVISKYFSEFFKVVEKMDRRSAISTINELKDIVEECDFCTPLIAAFYKGYDSFFDDNRTNGEDIHYWLLDMTSDIRDYLDNHHERSNRYRILYTDFPSSEKLIELISRLDDIDNKLYSDENFSDKYPISDNDTEYFDDLVFDFSEYLEESGVITNEVRNYITNDSCTCFDDSRKNQILDSSLRRELLYMNPDTSLFGYFKLISKLAKSEKLKRGEFDLDVPKLIMDLDEFIKHTKETTPDLNEDEMELIEEDIPENAEEGILQYVEEYSNHSLSLYDKDSVERQETINVLVAISHVCENNDVSILTDSIKETIKTELFEMIDRLKGTSRKIFELISKLHKSIKDADRDFNRLTDPVSVIESWDKGIQDILNSNESITDQDILDIQKIKRQYRSDICATIEKLYDVRDHLDQYMFDSSEEDEYNEITKKMIPIFESFKNSSLLDLNMFDSEEDAELYAELEDQVNKCLRLEKGESGNEEPTNYEWGDDTKIECNDEVVGHLDGNDTISEISDSTIESNNDVNDKISANEIAATQEVVPSTEEMPVSNKEGIEEFKDLMEELKKKMNEKPSEALAFYRNNLKCYLVDDNIPMDTRDMLKSLEEKLIDKKYEKYSKAREYMASQKGGRRRNKKRSGRK